MTDGYDRELLDLVKAYWEASNPHNPTAWAQYGIEMLNEVRAGEAIDLTARSVPFKVAGRRMLEVGCGVGGVQAVARARGIASSGIEPSLLGARAAARLLQSRGMVPAVVCSVGEQLPFLDGAFDVVCSFQVLEHTREPQMVLDESIRVLKPGGWFVHVFPNYGSVWEGHYAVPWFPHLPKSLGRVYLRLLRRNLAMLEEIQLLTQGRVAHMLRRHPEVRVVDWGTAIWEQRIRTLEFSEWAHLSRLKAAVRVLHRLHVVEPAITIGRWLRMETPIVLVVQKDG